MFAMFIGQKLRKLMSSCPDDKVNKQLMSTEEFAVACCGGVQAHGMELTRVCTFLMTASHLCMSP